MNGRTVKNIDLIALEAARAIEEEIKTCHIGGVTQRAARMQVIVIDAIKAATSEIPGPGFGPLEGAVENHGTQVMGSAGRPANSADRRSSHFTLVFAGDIRKFKANPLTTETPFGIAETVGVGDAFEECDRLRETLELACEHARRA